MPGGQGQRGGGKGSGRGRCRRGAGAGMSGQGEGGMKRGAAGYCVCPGCGFREVHERGIPCADKRCPNCGTQMVRED